MTYHENDIIGFADLTLKLRATLPTCEIIVFLPFTMFVKHVLNSLSVQLRSQNSKALNFWILSFSSLSLAHSSPKFESFVVSTKLLKAFQAEWSFEHERCYCCQRKQFCFKN